jgi:hypothetical protein
MKMMITVNQTLMLEWMRIKKSEEYGSYINVMWNLVRNISSAKMACTVIPTGHTNLPVLVTYQYQPDGFIFGW